MALPPGKIGPMNKRKVLELLNEAVAHEYAALIQFQTWAAFLEGLDGDAVAPALREMAKDETGHAGTVLERIWALGGKPDMKVGHVTFTTDTRQALRLGIKLEQEVIALYQKLLAEVPHTEVILYETIEDILEDEQKDLERLRRLQGR